MKIHQKISAAQLLPADDNNHQSHTLYDLQFDHDGQYVAEGVILQSRSPRSDRTPLPKELYFDQSLWIEDVTWDCFDHNLKLETKEIDANFIRKKFKNDLMI